MPQLIKPLSQNGSGNDNDNVLHSLLFPALIPIEHSVLLCASISYATAHGPHLLLTIST